MVRLKAQYFVIWALIFGFIRMSHAEIIGDWTVTKDHFCTLYIKANLNVKLYRTQADIDKEKVSVGVIAHEVAHCIIDHHFTVPPPPKIAEMLAHYAELHLKV